MEQNVSKTPEQEKKPVIEFKEVQKPFSLIIEDSARKKIEILCKRIHREEWSGPIFYKEEGSFAENNLIIRVVDLFLMDIGVSTYTEFSDSPDIIAYMLEKDLLDTRIGLVHSHNIMETFFSGTDTATLKQEALNHNHFVSLIVNNRGAHSAAITTVLNSKFKTSIEETWSYDTFDGIKVEGVDSHEHITEKISILWSKMKVVVEGVQDRDEELSQRIEDVLKEKEEIKKKSLSKNLPVIIPGKTPTVTSHPDIIESKVISIRPTEDDPLMGKLPSSNKNEPEFDFQKDDLQVDDSFDFSYDIKLKPELTILLCKKIVTGSILVPSDNKMELAKFIPSMEKLYKNIFNTIEDYEFFIGGFIESIIFDVKAENIIGFPAEVVAAIVSNCLVNELSKYPKNDYLDCIVETLSNYIL